VADVTVAPCFAQPSVDTTRDAGRGRRERAAGVRRSL
jgi:hypothetical protein